MTGARYGELASLRASDFNADSGTVHVRTSKSGKGRHIVLGDEGVAVFKSFVAGKSGEVHLERRYGVDQVTSGPTDGRSL